MAGWLALRGSAEPAPRGRASVEWRTPIFFPLPAFSRRRAAGRSRTEMKILLVDDDSDLLDVTAYALRREGLNVIVATDGQQALRRCEGERPDLVVLDVGLPRTDGFEVCRRIRQGSSTPVILLTGLSADEHVVRGFRAGA